MRRLFVIYGTSYNPTLPSSSPSAIPPSNLSRHSNSWGSSR